MNELLKMFVKIEADMGELEKDLGEVEEKAEEATEGVVDKFKNAGKLIAGAIALDKVIDFGKMAVEASASANAMEAQFEQVFGSMQGKATESINNMSKELGIVPNRLKPSMSQLTSMFKGVGMESEKAMGTAEQVTRGAADAAAFYDVSMEQAQGSLTSFIKGNYEAGESVGIFATDAQMAQYAIEQGVVSTTAEWQKLDEATKMATRADYIQNMQNMSGATGQASREADGLENVMGNLKQTWQDFLAVVGQPILSAVIPILQGVTEAIAWLGDKVGAVISAYQQWAEQNPILAQTLNVFLITLTALIAGFALYSSATAIATAATTAFTAVMAVLTSPITLTMLAIAALVATTYYLYQNWQTIGPMLAQVWQNIRTWVVNAVTQMWNTVVNYFSQMWSSISSTTSNIYTTISTNFNNAVNTVRQKVTAMFNAVKEWFGKIPGEIKRLWGNAESYLRGINLYSIGSNIISGLLNGLRNAWGAVVSWVSEKASWITNKFKSAMRIHSPSRVFRDEIGKQIMAGLLIGLERGWQGVTSFMDNATSWLSATSIETPSLSTDYSSSVQATYTPPTRSKEVVMLEDIYFMLKKIADKDSNIYLNDKRVSEELEESLSYISELKNNRQKRIQGGFA